MEKQQKLLTDEQWELIAPVLASRGGSRISTARRGCRTAPVWKAACGFCKPEAAWRFLPNEFPSPATPARHAALRL
jgi:transposase